VDDLAISDWVATEFSSALSIKLRAGHIEPAHRADSLAMFARLTTNSFAVVPVSRLQFRTAAGFADQHRLGLRAGDALHLAVCADHDPLHTGPAAERCGFGAGYQDDVALMLIHFAGYQRGHRHSGRRMSAYGPHCIGRERA
jgi:hypothetical protein